MQLVGARILLVGVAGVAIASSIAACSTVSPVSETGSAADAALDATSMSSPTDAQAPSSDANASLDDDAGADADTCATARADYDMLLQTTMCGHCLTSKCSAFVANAGSECSTINASLAVFECEMVSHECTTSSALAAFNTVELKQLYTCGGICGDICHLAGAPTPDAGDDDDAEAALDASADASDAADAPGASDASR